MRVGSLSVSIRRSSASLSASGRPGVTARTIRGLPPAAVRAKARKASAEPVRDEMHTAPPGPAPGGVNFELKFSTAEIMVFEYYTKFPAPASSAFCPTYGQRIKSRSFPFGAPGSFFNALEVSQQPAASSAVSNPNGRGASSATLGHTRGNKSAAPDHLLCVGIEPTLRWLFPACGLRQC